MNCENIEKPFCLKEIRGSSKMKKNCSGNDYIPAEMLDSILEI